MNNLWGNIFKGRYTKEDALPRILQKVPIFEGLNSRELSQIERILHTREYHPEEAIFHQGDPGLGMYIIESGTVEILSDPGKDLLAELHDGDFFGELALLDESPRTATAVSKARSKMLCFFQPDLFDLLERNPRLGVKVLFRLARTIGERLRKTNEQMHDLKNR
jgi:CRP/FNR family cyclic AMP-dependent transcriptional regulator